MKLKSIYFLGMLLIALSINALSINALANVRTVEELSTQASSEDYSSAITAIRELRTMGKVGLDALFVKYATEIDKFAKTGEQTDDWKRIATEMSALVYLPLKTDIWDNAARIYFDLRHVGITIRSTIDACIAQTALDHKVEWRCSRSMLNRTILPTSSHDHGDLSQRFQRL